MLVVVNTFHLLSQMRMLLRFSGHPPPNLSGREPAVLGTVCPEVWWGLSLLRPVLTNAPRGHRGLGPCWGRGLECQGPCKPGRGAVSVGVLTSVCPLTSRGIWKRLNTPLTSRWWISTITKWWKEERQKNCIVFSNLKSRSFWITDSFTSMEAKSRGLAALFLISLPWSFATIWKPCLPWNSKISFFKVKIYG